MQALFEDYRSAARSKTTLTIPRMLTLGVLAGLFIALAAIGANIAGSTITVASVAKLVGALVFPVGLALVVVTGSELFTGNCLLVTGVLMREIRLRAMLKNLLFAYIGNFIGSMIGVALACCSGSMSLFSNAAAVGAISCAVTKTSLPFGGAIVSGIACNILVCGAVLLAMKSKSSAGKIVALYLPIMLFVLCGFEHCVADMYYIPAGLIALTDPAYAASAAAAGIDFSGLTWGSFFLNNLLPVTIGNIIGGCGLGAALYLSTKKKEGEISR